MQGMRFLIVAEDGRPVNHGLIAQKISEDKFLCQFARSPSSCRLVHTDEIMNWNLFPTDEGMNDFIERLAQERPPEQSAERPPVDLEIGQATNDPQKKTPRKKAKKTAKKKPNGKTKR